MGAVLASMRCGLWLAIAVCLCVVSLRLGTLAI